MGELLAEDTAVSQPWDFPLLLSPRSGPHRVGHAALHIPARLPPLTLPINGSPRGDPLGCGASVPGPAGTDSTADLTSAPLGEGGVHPHLTGQARAAKPLQAGGHTAADRWSGRETDAGSSQTSTAGPRTGAGLLGQRLYCPFTTASQPSWLRGGNRGPRRSEAAPKPPQQSRYSHSGVSDSSSIVSGWVLQQATPEKGKE